MPIGKVARKIIAKLLATLWRPFFKLFRINFRAYHVVFYSITPFEETFLAPIIRSMPPGLRVAVIRGVKGGNVRVGEWGVYDSVDLYFLPVQYLKNVRCGVFVTAKSMGGNKQRLPVASRYVHVPHSLVSLHTIYPEHSFDAFDCLLAAGPHHEKEFLCLKGGSEARVFPVGYGRFETLSQSYSEYQAGSFFANSLPTVMIAPSWHEGNLLSICGETLIQRLLDGRFNVIVRPHFKTLTKDRDLVKKIRERFSSNAGFVFDDFRVGGGIFGGVDCLLSDYSGVPFEFSLITGNPTVFVNLPPKRRNTENICDFLEAFEVYAREQVGVVCDADADCVIEGVEAALGGRHDIRVKIEKARRSLCFGFYDDFGFAGSDAINVLVRELEAR